MIEVKSFVLVYQQINMNCSSGHLSDCLIVRHNGYEV